jgi:hypothetical protein
MRRAPTIAELRRELVEDSVTRRNALAKLIALIREDERAKTLDALDRAKATAEREGSNR